MGKWFPIDTALDEYAPAAMGKPVLLYVPKFEYVGWKSERPDELTDVHIVVGKYRGRAWDASGYWISDVTFMDDAGCYYPGDIPEKVPLHIEPTYWQPLDDPPEEV